VENTTYEDIEAWYARQLAELESLRKECIREDDTAIEAFLNLRDGLLKKKCELLLANGLV
jgi:hypothetical protein